ncbi:hypothetical protein KIL84_015133 [Mauremys mutica]|uniref:Uncharacterized protein n=1 Tax=Mauremys mutica TaxID=74926 RepID=A0A9D4BB82_9SAUR|nr:hypothetical protein KIL84_015133 [Mauremys mutica]
MGGGRLAPQKKSFFKLKDFRVQSPLGVHILGFDQQRGGGGRVEFGVSVQYEVTWGRWRPTGERNGGQTLKPQPLSGVGGRPQPSAAGGPDSKLGKLGHLVTPLSRRMSQA